MLVPLTDDEVRALAVPVPPAHRHVMITTLKHTREGPTYEIHHCRDCGFWQTNFIARPPSEYRPAPRAGTNPKPKNAARGRRVK